MKTKEQQRIDDAVSECLGQFTRKERFEKGERVTLEETVEKYGCYPKMCHNCAFRADSVEMKFARENYPAQIWTIFENIDSAVEKSAPFEPFFCHREMPSDDGGQNFQPERDGEGLPVGHRLCAGWTAEVKKQIEFQERLKTEDDGV